MSTQFAPIEIPPGVVSMGTKQMRSSNWVEVNFIRWREGNLMPMGGQAQYTSLDAGGNETYFFASKCKKIHGWYGLDGIYRIAYLCESNLYVDVGGSITEITPVDGIAPSSGLVGGFGDGLFSAGTFSTPRPVSPENAALRVPDAYSLDNFGTVLYAMASADGRLLRWDPGAGTPGQSLIMAAGAAFTTASSNITMSAVNPGTVVPGMNVYDRTNSQPIGMVLSWVGTALILTQNALHASAGAADNLNFGNLAATQLATPSRGPVPRARCFVVTQERFIMVFGSTQDGTADGGSSRRMAWCDQENPGAWDYSSVTSQAGFQDIEPASPIVCALASRVGVLFWTGKKVYASKFLGLPYVYNYTELADGTTPWSPQSMATTSSLALWMSEQGLFSYDGTSVLPVACQIRSWIDDTIDIVNVREESFACHVVSFNEWWWFFPEENVIIQKPDGSQYITNTRAMIFNYKEGWFTQVRCSRSAGFGNSYTSPVIMADVFTAFQHETGNVYANYSIPAQPPFAETFDLNLNSGAILTTVKQMMPNVEGDISNLLYSIFYRNSRSLGMAELQSTPVPVRPDGYVDFRVTGRDIRLRFDCASSIVQPFTLGQHLIDATGRGDR